MSFTPEPGVGHVVVSRTPGVVGHALIVALVRAIRMPVESQGIARKSVAGVFARETIAIDTLTSRG